MKRTLVATIVLFILSVIGLQAEENVIPAPPEGALKYSITVTEFKNEANWGGKWAIGTGMTTIMTDMLNQSGWFITLGDSKMRQEAMKEQDFGASGCTASGKKTPQMGRMTPAQLLVRGSITHVQEVGSKGGGVSFMGVSVGGDTGSAEINLTIYLVNSETGQVMASKSVIGESGRAGYKFGYHGSALGGLGGFFGGEDKDNVGKAAEDAIGQAVAYLVQQLETIPWEGTVVLANGDKIMMNRGEREGVKVGASFQIGQTEEILDPDTGEVLDRDMSIVATATVTKVKEKIAYLKPVTGEGKIEKGMSVFPLGQ